LRSDLNGDGYLDEKELEAIFYHEARALHEMYVCVCMCAR
jgi:hypothetical protein